MCVYTRAYSLNLDLDHVQLIFLNLKKRKGTCHQRKKKEDKLSSSVILAYLDSSKTSSLTLDVSRNRIKTLYSSSFPNVVKKR